MILISVYPTKARHVSNDIYILARRMTRNKISDNIKGIIKTLLTKKHLHYVIQQEPARKNLNASKSTISRITNKIVEQRRLCLLNSRKPKFHRCRHRTTPSTVRRIAS